MAPLIAVVAAAAIQVAAARLHIGVASKAPDGQICVALPGPRLASGAVVTLVEPDSQSVLATTIEGPVASCEALERSMVSGPYYVLRRPTAPAEDRKRIWVAFVGQVASRKSAAGRLVLRLSAREPNAQVRFCTTQEGVILTIWAGTPLQSRRLWGEYYYLGYDVDPSCTKGDRFDPVR